jgi:hypothetical protein
VDVTYPGNKTAMESGVQQFGISALLLVPLADMATQEDFQLLRNNPTWASNICGDVVLLMAILKLAVMFAYFSGFDASLLRTIAGKRLP